MTDHTPLPWLGKQEPTCWSIEKAERRITRGHSIAKTVGAKKRENAGFILRACNNHYEMLETLQLAANWFVGAQDSTQRQFVFEKIQQAIVRASKC